MTIDFDLIKEKRKVKKVRKNENKKGKGKEGERNNGIKNNSWIHYTQWERSSVLKSYSRIKEEGKGKRNYPNQGTDPRF